MRDSACRWCIAKKRKIFWSYVNDTHKEKLIQYKNLLK